MSQTPVLPYGSPTTLSGLSETFSFHSSPESFITSRVLAFHKAHPDLAESNTPIRAKILNRNVAVISSYDHIRQILCDEKIASSLSSSQAYDELMAPFFPPPNLLLLDPPDHHNLKQSWLQQMVFLNENIQPLVRDTVLAHFLNIPSGSVIDIYESMKSLSWQVLLSVFIQKDQDAKQEENSEIEALHEDLLRGQFSLFPVNITTRFWRSAKSKGLHARQTLESMLSSKAIRGKCPFMVDNPKKAQDVAAHLLLFTSSLAAKGLASLLTAVLLNLFFFKEGGSDLITKVQGVGGFRQRSNYIQSMIMEVERLSPPVVGIMRRTTQDIFLHGKGEITSPTLVPKAWDLWLYFVGAARDQSIFGGTAETFVPIRYLDKISSQQQGLAFGAGAKTCLGRDLMRMVARTVVETCLGNDQGAKPNHPSETPVIKLQSNRGDFPVGVQGWLGWQSKVKPEEWARDIKQLPTQRPRKPIMVKITHQLGS